MERRQFLWSGLTVAGAATVGTACAPLPGPSMPDGTWDCGVASGLHSPDAAVLWTRFAPGAVAAVDVQWEIAIDPGFASVVANGTQVAEPSRDGCVKVLAEGLAPGTHHWYRFTVGTSSSPVGRTKTLPDADTEPPRVRLAVGSCQNFAAGFYPAWRSVAATDLDGVVHLGDYIYESRGDRRLPWDVRADPSAAAVDLATYRAKYRLCRSDPDLQAAHAAHGWAPVWDDHEFVDNFHTGTLGDHPDRAAAAFRAWFEYQPVWPSGGDRIHRRLRFGRLLDLSMLDTRQYRDPNPEQDILVVTSVPPGSVVHEPGRSILGADQRDWLLDGLGAAQGDGVTWKVLGQQVMMAPLRMIDLDEPWLPPAPQNAGVYFNVDQWDGYSWERNLLTAHLHDEGITNATVLTGDIHSFWQAAIRLDMEDSRSPAVAQEFVCGSISSMALAFLPELADAFSRFTRGFPPGFRWVDWGSRGYGLLEARDEEMRVEFHAVDASRRNGADRTEVRFDWPEGTHDVALSRGG